METEIFYRKFKPEDGPAFTKLANLCPDAGQINFHFDYLVDLYTLYDNLQFGSIKGIVAENSSGEMVAACACTLGDNLLQYENQLYPYVYGSQIFG